MKRCFIALTLPPTTRHNLAAVQQELAALAPRAARTIKPVREENLHLTLKFLGPTDGAMVAELTDAIYDIATGWQPRQVTVQGLGAFPGVTHPRAVFGAITEGAETLVALADRIEQACERLGFLADMRPRHPHVTLARIEGCVPGGPLSQWLQAAPATVFGPVDCHTISLYESRLHPSGSIYTPLVRVQVAPR